MDLSGTRAHRLILVVALISFMGLWSCAVPIPVETGSRWSCDDQADQAVKEGDWQRALAGHQAHLAAEPDDCLAIYHLGYIRGRLGDRDKEIEEFERAAACGYDQDDKFYFNLGMAYAESNRMQDAIEAFNQAIVLKPASADNHFGLGMTAMACGRTQMARQALSRAVAIDPRHWDARIELARLELDQGRLEQARVQLEAVQEGAPEHEELQTLWRVYHDRKITTFDDGKSDK